MPGTINTLETFPTVDFMSADEPARGMAFKIPSDGNIYLAVINTTFLALDKTTGAVVFATNANDLQWKTNWNDASDTFLNASAGGAPNFDIAQFDGVGALIDNPATGANPYGAIISNGNYFCGDTGDNFITVLDAATGAPVASIDTTVSGPTTNVGQWADDGSSIWCSAINSFLIEIDPIGLTLLNIYDLTGQSVGRIAGMCFALGFLWLVDVINGNIVKCDLAGNVISTSAAFGAGPLIFDGTYFWMCDTVTNTLSVYDNAAVFQALTALPAQGQDVAHDPADAPGIVWATSGGPPSQVQKFQFVPVAPGSSTGFPGTFTGFITANQMSGGST